MEVLRELNLARPDLIRHPRFEIFLDGGITRGTDVIKALCLGARAVGLGRAFLYANGVWGEAGCTRVISSKWLLNVTFTQLTKGTSHTRRDDHQYEAAWCNPH
jgi:glutamate synthase domain-containing protein 2